MRYFAKFNNGERETSYVEGIHFNIIDGVPEPPLPEGFIEITEEEQYLYASGDYIRNAEGKPERRPKHVPTIDEIIYKFTGLIQQRLDEFARTLTYDNILSACTYSTSNVEMYRIEGQYCVVARDATWAKAYELMEKLRPLIEAGGETPTWEDIEEQLPPLVWPEGSRGYISA